MTNTSPGEAAAASLAASIRLRSARMVSHHGFGYLGQALSSAELLAVFASEMWRPEQDRFVVSPGHYIVAAYAIGAELGLLDERELATYGADGSRLEAIGTESSPVVDLTCGSLAQCLSGAAGFALGARLTGRDQRSYVLVSDGELQEGQTWEAALFAGHHRLDNLIAILDLNNSQVDGPVDSVTTIEPVADKWRAFGWDAIEVDGHDIAQVSDAFQQARSAQKPAVVIGRTSTRQGLTCLPEDADGHFIKLPPDLAHLAIQELEAAVRA